MFSPKIISLISFITACAISGASNRLSQDLIDYMEYRGLFNFIRCSNIY